MKVFITGVAGMLGSHLSEILLNKNFKVYGIDNLAVGRKSNIKNLIKNKNFTFFKGDINKKKNIYKFVKKVDIVVHLAAIKKVTELQPSYKTLTTNVFATKIILDAVKLYKKKMIFASTSDVYGISEKLPFNEKNNLIIGSSLAKRWSYAVSKIYCEHLCYCYHKDYKVNLTILRYFGGFSHKSSFSWSGGHIPLFIEKIIKKEVIEIHGDGRQTRSMGHAIDLAYGTYLAIISNKINGEIINIGNNEEISVLDTLKIISKKMKISMNKLKIKHVPQSKIFGNYKDIRRRRPDIKLAKQKLGFKPKISLEKAIELVIDEKKKSNK